MTFKLNIVLLILLTSIMNLKAQNIHNYIINGSFESIIQSPDPNIDFNSASRIFAPPNKYHGSYVLDDGDGATTDPIEDFTLPTSYFGYQNAHSGNSCGGIIRRRFKDGGTVSQVRGEISLKLDQTLPICCSERINLSLIGNYNYGLVDIDRKNPEYLTHAPLYTRSIDGLLSITYKFK